MADTHDDASTKDIVVVGRGQIGTPLVARLCELGHRVLWLSRTSPTQLPRGARHQSLDASDGAALARAARDARAMIAAVNPATYDAGVWAETLPPLHRGLIQGASQAGVRLVVLDALYLYSMREGPLAPHTPHAAETEKGKIRMAIAALYEEAMRSGQLRASLFRASDFWGPGLSSALLTDAVVAGLRAGKAPMLIGNPDVPHAFTHRDDVVNGLIALALAGDDVEGRVFHAPVIHVSQRELVAQLSAALGVEVKPRVLSRWMLRLAGLFSRSTRGLVEMLPQWEAPYLVDDSSYVQRFGTPAISLEQGIAQLAHA